MAVEIVDRYTVMGPPNGCQGHCEGTGWVPVISPPGDSRRTFYAPRLKKNVTSTFEGVWALKDDASRALQDAWREADAAKPSDDGYHFLRCPDCNIKGVKHG